MTRGVALTLNRGRTECSLSLVCFRSVHAQPSQRLVPRALHRLAGVHRLVLAQPVRPCGHGQWCFGVCREHGAGHRGHPRFAAAQKCGAAQLPDHWPHPIHAGVDPSRVASVLFGKRHRGDTVFPQPTFTGLFACQRGVRQTPLRHTTRCEGRRPRVDQPRHGADRCRLLRFPGAHRR